MRFRTKFSSLHHVFETIVSISKVSPHNSELYLHAILRAAVEGHHPDLQTQSQQADRTDQPGNQAENTESGLATGIVNTAMIKGYDEEAQIDSLSLTSYLSSSECSSVNNVCAFLAPPEPVPTGKEDIHIGTFRGIDVYFNPDCSLSSGEDYHLLQTDSDTESDDVADAELAAKFKLVKSVNSEPVVKTQLTKIEEFAENQNKNNGKKGKVHEQCYADVARSTKEINRLKNKRKEGYKSRTRSKGKVIGKNIKSSKDIEHIPNTKDPGQAKIDNPTPAEAREAGIPSAPSETSSVSEVVKVEKPEYVVSLPALQSSNRSKNLLWTDLGDRTHRLQGKAYFDSKPKDPPLQLNGVFREQTIHDKFLDQDSTGVIVKVLPRPGPPIEPFFTCTSGTNLKLSGSVKDRMRLHALSIVQHAINTRYMYDRTNTFRKLETEWKRFENNYPGMKVHVAEIMDEEWFREKMVTLGVSLTDSWYTVTKARLAAYYGDRGSNLAYHIKVANTKLVAVLIAKAALPQLVALILFCYTSYTFPVIFTTMFSAYLLREAIPRLVDEGLEVMSLKNLLDKCVISEGLHMGVTPCSKLFLDKFTYDKELRPFPPMREGATLIIDEVEVRDEKVEIFGCTTEGDMAYPTQSNANLEAALRIRCAFDRPTNEDTERELYVFGKFVIDLMDEIDVSYEEEPRLETYKHLCSKYGKNRADDLMQWFDVALDDRDIWYELFVKAEAYKGKNADNAKPRMIWKPTDKLLVKLGLIWSKISKGLQKHFSKDSNFYYTSGGTPADLGNFAETMSQFVHKYEADVSNWDGSLIKVMLMLEVYFLRNKTVGWDPAILTWVIANYYKRWGKSKDGKLIFKMLDSARMSGSHQTSPMNTLLNIIITLFVLYKEGVRLGEWVEGDFMKVTKVVKGMFMGDDNTVATDLSFDPNRIIGTYKELGMTVVLEEREEMSDVGYCSGYFVPVGQHLLYQNMPFKILTNIGVNHGKHPTKLHKSLLYGQAKGLLTSGGAMPVLGDLLRAIVEDAESKNIKIRVDNRAENPYRITGGCVYEPTVETYQWFSDKYCIPLADVYLLSESVRNMTLDMFPCTLQSPLLSRGLAVDLSGGLRLYNVNLTAENIHDTIYSIPYEEEVEKLKGAETMYQAIQNAIKFGKEEVSLGHPSSHIGLHVYFTALSFLKLDWGVQAHRNYNAGVLNIIAEREYSKARGRNIKFRTPCSKKFTASKSKSKPKPPASKPNKQSQKPTKLTSQLSKFFIANLAPMHDSAIGAKIPDSTTLKSIAFPLVQDQVITIDANGYGMAVLRCDGTNMFCTPDAISSIGVATWLAGGALTGLTTVFSESPAAGDCPAYRAVAGGVRISCEAKADDVAGTIHIGHFPDFVATNNTDPLATSYWPNARNDITHISDSTTLSSLKVWEDPHDIIFKMVDTIHPYKYWTQLTYNSGVGFKGNRVVDSWANIVVYIEGAVPGVTYNLKQVVHIECLSNATDPTHVKATASVASPSMLTSIATIAPKVSVVKSSDANKQANTLIKQAIAGFTGVNSDAMDVGIDFAVSVAPKVFNAISPYLDDFAGLLDSIF